nr:DoxX family protein [Kibdelosporangium sp. MJ126-NF4]CTQ93874.1 Membrane protein, distant similarity to thiosulphate:quinone oxidoreductase DoxD [Kibdelosporangium sp. MJ126-NF4]
MLDIGLLVIRVPAGLLLAGHGTQKLFGWFGGDGLAATGEAFENLGYRRGRVMAAVAGLTEVAAGLGLAVGLLTPLAAAAVIGVMINAAATAHRANGLWAQNGGYEYPLVVAALAAGVALHGAGTLSVDAVLGLEQPDTVWAGAAVGLGVVVAAVTLGAARQRKPRT